MITFTAATERRETSTSAERWRASMHARSMESPSRTSVEAPFAGEERLLVPSPKVATYDLQPEMSAHEVTDRLVAAGEVLGIRVLDHMIVGDGRYISFSDEGWLAHSGREV